MSASDTFATEITAQDVEFLQRVKGHFELCAGIFEKRGQTKEAGVMRREAFYAERILARVTPARVVEP